MELVALLAIALVVLMFWTGDGKKTYKEAAGKAAESAPGEEKAHLLLVHAAVRPAVRRGRRRRLPLSVELYGGL